MKKILLLLMISGLLIGCEFTNSNTNVNKPQLPNSQDELTNVNLKIDNTNVKIQIIHNSNFNSFSNDELRQRIIDASNKIK